jgi:hypothetical protein
MTTEATELETLGKRVAKLELLCLQLATRARITDPTVLPEPVNDCKACGGSGHLMRLGEITRCQCFTEFSTRVTAYEKAKRQPPKKRRSPTPSFREISSLKGR